MTLIRIRERSAAPDGFNAAVSYNHGPEYPVTIGDPFSTEEEQRQWAQAKDYYLRALETYVVYKDDHNRGIVLRSLARLWQASDDATLPAAVAALLGLSPGEAEELLR